MINFLRERDLQVFPSRIEENYKVLVIFKFWPKWYPDPKEKFSNWLILKFIFIHFKAVKVSENDQIKM